MSDSPARTIVVFGSSRPRPGDPAWQEAFEVGRSLAAAGFRMANGGYGGTMAASAAGAREVGGHVTGVTCNPAGWGTPNEHLTDTRDAPDLHQRLRELIDIGDGYVVLPGMTGTLAELSLAWELVAKKLIPRRPIVCVGTFWQPLLDMMAAADAKRGDWLMRADTPDAVVAALQNWMATHDA